jgi:hypothetical protein
VEATTKVDPAALCEQIHCRKPEAADVRIVMTAAGARLMRGEKELTPLFAAIGSFDVSSERKEVVFSAKRKDNFDVGLVSVDGSDIHWIFEDPADETLVQWAPKGNKISYVMHSATGDLVRTVHIPTGTTLTVPYRWSRIRAQAWEPSAARISIILSGANASEHVESLKYDGEAQRTDVAPAARLDVTAESFGGGVLLRPPVARYGQRAPLVVWIGDPASWSDGRATLLRTGSVACAVIPRPPDAAFWAAAAELGNLDLSQVWVVGTAAPPSAVAGEPAATRYIAPSAELPAGRYRMAGRVLYAPSAVVQSVAAGFIADQLKRNDPRNGSHR